MCGHEGSFLKLKTWYVSLPSCFIRLKSFVVFWPPATQRKRCGIIRMAHPAPPASVSLSLNEPEVMVTLVGVFSRSHELRNERDHFSYYVVVCGSKKLVWRPSTLTIYCPVATIRIARCNIKQFYVLHTQCIVCFVWICEQTAIISLYNINWLVCITETECVYCAVGTESSNIIHINTSL